MSDVYLAATDEQHVDFTKLVVLKKLREEYAQDGEFVTMFLDEARIAARLNHPNVIQTLEVGQVDEEYYLAMEYLEGQPFSRIISASAYGMPLGMHLSIISEALNGLHYAHELKDYDGTPLNMVHRDVTPHNVFVTYTGQVKVMDFGIAKAAGRIAETRFGVIKGKVGYMAPEQVALRSLDRRADIFAAGVAVYEAATRRRMWGKTPQSEVLKQLLRGEHPGSPKLRKSDVHEELDRICGKALAYDPEQRYPTALAFQEDLDAFIEDHERRPSPRQLGAFVASQFSQQQERARSVIESQLKDLVSSRRTVVMIDIDGDDADQAPFSGESAPRPLPPSDSGPRSKTPSALIEDSFLKTTHTKLSEGITRRRPWRLPALIGIGIAALIVIGVGASGALTTSAPVASQPKPDVTLILRATPMDARFKIDDGPPLDNPYVGRVSSDDKIHIVRVEAPGYVGETEDVRFDRDVSMRFALGRVGQ
jgi:eukaryotic-like serine/threonine-protein kinase